MTVVPTYLHEHSEPAEHAYRWAYTVVMENNSDRTVKLLNRHWKIIDARGKMQEVRGAGVVGEQPILKPNQAFRYTSGTQLATESGIMSGEYEMMDAEGNRFDVEVPAFSLDSPFVVARPN